MTTKTTLLLALAAAVSLTACKDKLDAGKLEGSMTADLVSKGLTGAKVSCPSGRDAKAGDTFTCDGTDDGAKFTITVEQKDDAGNVQYKLDGQILDTSLVVADAKSQMPGATFTCAKKNVVVKNSDTYKCAIAGATQKELVIKIDGANVSWSAT